jgi:cardiolipin synthase
VKYVEGNRLTLLKNGEQYFPALRAALDRARSEVFFETYIFADDEAGGLVADALARAAARKVTVHVLLDGFGASDFPRHIRDMLAGAGAQVLMFRPEISRWRWRRSRLRRMHRKLACVDAGVAFVGGINVIDDRDTQLPMPPRYDYAVRVEGPLALEVRAQAAKLWSRVAWAAFGRRLRGFDALMGTSRAQAPADGAAAGEGQRAALLVRDNVRHRNDIEDGYLKLIAGARREIVIANAYFFPGRRFRQALASAARRGVRVVLLLQGRVEYALLHYASRALYGSLLDAGIEIQEYHRSYLHAKVAVFDSRWAIVGSSNIDPFSLLLAREANVFVDDRGFATELRASLLEAMRTGARAVPPQRWKHQSVWLRIRIWIGYGLARLLLSITGTDRLD